MIQNTPRSILMPNMTDLPSDPPPDDDGFNYSPILFSRSCSHNQPYESPTQCTGNISNKELSFSLSSSFPGSQPIHESLPLREQTSDYDIPYSCPSQPLFHRCLVRLSHIINSLPAEMRGLLSKSEGWILVASIAMLTGFSAAWIEIAVVFLSDLRLGVCQGMLWQNRSFCCGSRSAVDAHKNACSFSESPVVHMDYVDHSKWFGWSTLLHIKLHTLSYFVDYGMYVLIGVTLAVAAAWFCQVFAKSAAGSGIPEVKAILGGFPLNNALSALTCIIKCLGLSLGVASGLSLGKEGPLVHVACCWATILGNFFTKYKNSERKRELLSAASAAGVSVAFGAPLGGVLFSFEEVSSNFPAQTLWKSFFCAIVGALSFKYLDASGSGRLTLFQMDSVSLLGSWQLVELIPFAIIGLLGGVLGTLLIRFNVQWMIQKRQYRVLGSHPIYEVALVTIATCLVNYPLLLLRLSSSSTLEQLFSRCGVGADHTDIFSLCSLKSDAESSYSDYSLKWSVFLELIFTCFLRFVQTVFTFGIGVPAGLFIPSLMLFLGFQIGALFGRLVGLAMIKLNAVFGFVVCHKCLHPGVYAIVGAAAMLGGVTRATISIVVIMFELTGGLSYVVPFMVTVLIAKWIGEAFCNRSIYDCYIRLKGYPYLDEHSDYALTACVSDIMDTQCPVITLQSNTVMSLYDLVTKCNCFGFPLIKSHRDREIVGFITSSDLIDALNSATHSLDVSSGTIIVFYQQSHPDLLFTRRPARLKTLEVTPRGISLEMIRTDRDDQSPQNQLPDTKTPTSPASRSIRDNTPNFNSIQNESVLDFSHIVDKHVLQIIPETPLTQVYNIFKQLELKVCFLATRGCLVGLLTRERFLERVNCMRIPDGFTSIVRGSGCPNQQQ